MKVAVCSQGMSLDSMTDSRLGRCACFVLIDPATGHHEGVVNPWAQAGGGAGTRTAQFLAGQGVEVVLAGNVGPNAIRALDAAKVQVYVGISGTVADAVSQYRAGELALADGPTAGASPVHPPDPKPGG